MHDAHDTLVKSSGYRVTTVVTRAPRPREMLSPDDAQIITLFYKGEQTLEEIAQILGKEPNAVKVQLHRARARLKDKMEKYFSAEVRDIYSP